MDDGDPGDSLVHELDKIFECLRAPDRLDHRRSDGPRLLFPVMKEDG